MSYTVEISRRAGRDLAAIGQPERKRVGRKIDALGEDPRPAGARKVKGSDQIYRIRSGDFRIIYEVRDHRLIVLVIMIRQRGRAYEDLRRLLGGR